MHLLYDFLLFLEIFCPDEPDPSNGTVIHQNTTVNGEISYSCHPGYNVSTGNLNRKCLSNGTWSGDPPICLGEQNLFHTHAHARKCARTHASNLMYSSTQNLWMCLVQQNTIKYI